MAPRSTDLCGWLVALFAFGGVGAARADEAADTAAARRLGSDGLNLADAGNCPRAIEPLRRAEELHHAPPTAARLGECEIDVGRLVSGTERLQRLLREPMPVDAPTPFVDAFTRARTVLERARPRIATLHIEVKAPPGTKVQVLVDGEPLSDALVGSDRPTDPGHHLVEARGTGVVSVARDVSLGDGEATSVSLELVSAPATGGASPSQSAPIVGASAQASASPPRATYAAPIAAFSVGGLGLATGIVSGLVTAFDSADLSKSCSATRQCPSDKQAELSAAKTWATISTVSFAVAGAGLGTGVLLLVLHKGEAERSSEASIHPIVGPLYVGFTGAF